MNLILMVLALVGYSDRTNVELAEEALVMACVPIPDSLASMGVDCVTLQIEGTHEGGWFLEQTLTAILDDRGVLVAGSPEDRSAQMVLSVRPMELRVGYGDINRPWIVGAKRVERIATVEVSTQLIDSAGSVVMTMRTSGTAADVISWDDADALAGSDSWTWLSSELPEGGEGGILEPLIVTGVVASLVYLFYSSRAD
jgi:hypothetical protein